MDGYPRRLDGLAGRFQRVGDGDHPEEVAARQRAQMGAPHAARADQPHAEDRHGSGPPLEARAGGRSVGRFLPRAAGEMGVDDGLAQRDIAEGVLARGQGRLPPVTQSWKWISSSLKLSA